MDGSDVDGWSAVAGGWAELWGGFAEPAWTAVLEASGVGPGDRVLDVGCGSGDLLAHLDGLGLTTAGVDPASGMVALARARVPAADVQHGEAERLPWPNQSFDLVTAVNALQLAEDVEAGLDELVRVTVTGGRVAVVTWAEAALNDLDTIEAAVACADGDEPSPDSELRLPGRLERLLTDGGLELVDGGVVEVPWSVLDDDTLVRGVLLGEETTTLMRTAPTVIAAAQSFRTPDGGYRLLNHFRYAVGCRTGSTG